MSDFFGGEGKGKKCIGALKIFKHSKYRASLGQDVKNIPIGKILAQAHSKHSSTCQLFCQIAVKEVVTLKCV